MLETDTSLQPKIICHVSLDICVIWVDDEPDETQPQLDLKSGFEKSWCLRWIDQFSNVLSIIW